MGAKERVQGQLFSFYRAVKTLDVFTRDKAVKMNANDEDREESKVIRNLMDACENALRFYEMNGFEREEK